MNPQRALQLLTIAYLVICGLSVALNLATEELLPEPLRSWSINQTEAMGPVELVVLLVLALLTLGALIVASIALLQMKKWGAWLHLGASIPSLGLLLIVGPVVQHPLSYFVDYVGVLVAGCLYGVAFFSPAFAPTADVARPQGK